MRDVWRSGEAYEAYIGRWSRLVAREFVPRLSIPRRSRWLDIGCGSGALTEAILTVGHPSRIRAVDRSIEYVQHSRDTLPGELLEFVVADAVSLPFADQEADAAVSGLVLNFVSQPELAVREMLRCLRPGGVIAVYLWDYAEGMQFIRLFWDAAIGSNAAASELDEAKRFPLCHPAELQRVFTRADAVNIEVMSIIVPTTFQSFEELWSPFLGGQGPAPTYAMSLPQVERNVLRERLHQMLPIAADGSIELTARAWVVNGVRQS